VEIEMGRTRLVKLSDEEYQMLQKAKMELARSGTKSLPPKVVDDAKKGDVSLVDLALGAIVGLGAAALIAALLGDDE
jgi:hypothetical protein